MIELKPCDIVMKGGITSGVVYPSAVWEISRLFRFKNVGGTSAGAIAAVLTAAAERSRMRGKPGGFDVVKGIPGELRTDGLLLRLFRPNKRTRSLFATVLRISGRGSFAGKLVALYAAYPWWALAGAAIPIALAWLSDGTWTDDVMAALLAALLSLGCAAAAFAFDLGKRVGENYNGLVTGISDDPRGELALTTWLEERIRTAAGIDDPHTPLTFNMLWDVRCEEARGVTVPPAERDVNLEMISTNVTFGRPFKFPFDTSQFFFSDAEMRDFFPEHVVAWMVQNRRRPAEQLDAYAAQGRYPFPPIGDLPVIVATRMSLAFPVLLSAVPAYAADFTERRNQQPGVPPELERSWFTDGGLSSNFPLTMFDAPVPGWPTFGINLRPFTKDYPRDDHDESKNVYLPNNNEGGRLPGFNRPKGLVGFLAAVFDAMQNWNDTTQAVLPGFRDRIVTVKLGDDEGGLNLDMPSAILQRLEARGAAAGRLIAERFAVPGGGGTPSAPTMGWRNHRWLRYRTTMGALKAYLSEFAAGARSAQPPLGELIHEEAVTPGSYELPSPDEAAELTARLTELAASFEQAGYLDTNLPKPAPELAVRPPLGMKA